MAEPLSGTPPGSRGSTPMAEGVDLLKIEVTEVDRPHIQLQVTLVVKAETEFDAIGWLVETLGKEL